MSYKGFMVMPFNNQAADHCYTYSLKPLFIQYGIELVRANEMFGVDPIADDIANAINQARVVVVDISDNNPNVFYELGLAHAQKRHATMVITGTSFDTVPFDVKHIRIIRYENTIQGKVKFECAVRKTLEQMTKQPTFYEAEFSILVKLMEFSPGLEQDLVRSMLVLKEIPPLDRPVRLKYEWQSGKERFHTDCILNPGSLLRDGHIQAFSLVEERNGAVYLTPKGEALAAYLADRGFRVIDLQLLEDEDEDLF